MRRVSTFCLTSLVLLASAPSARGQITAFWQRIPIHAAAIADDPVLAGMQTWDLMVSTSGNWVSAGMRATLPPNRFSYRHAIGEAVRPDPALVAQFPALAYTTYVTAPGHSGSTGAPSLLGGFPEGQPSSLGEEGSPTPGTFSLSWGDLTLDAPGTYQVARYTFPRDVFPNVINRNDIQTGNHSRTSQVAPDYTAELPDIPEPAAAFVLPVAAMLLVQRRRVHTDPSHSCARRRDYVAVSIPMFVRTCG